MTNGPPQCAHKLPDRTNKIHMTQNICFICAQKTEQTTLQLLHNKKRL